MCTDIFSNCFELIVTLGDLWPEEMGCPHFPSSDSTCFKPQLHDTVETNNVAIERTMTSTPFTNNLTHTPNMEFTTVSAGDESGRLVTNITVDKLIKSKIDQSQYRLGSTGSTSDVETARSAATLSALSETINVATTAKVTEATRRIATTQETSSPKITETTVSTPTTVSPTKSPKCELLTVESCYKYYNLTILPNGFGHETQSQAERNLSKRDLMTFASDVDSRYCAEYLESFICAGFLPPCGPGDLVIRYLFTNNGMLFELLVFSRKCFYRFSAIILFCMSTYSLKMTSMKTVYAWALRVT